MKLFDKLRQQKFLSITLMVFTLSVGIVIGTLVNTQVSAQKGQSIAPDATPLVVPKITQIGNEFSALAKKLEPSVVHITVEVSAKPTTTSGRRRAQPEDEDDDDSSDLLRRFFGNQAPGLGGGGAPQAQKREQSGTGFIVDRNGYIITNNHVVQGGDRIRVKIHNDPSEYRARVVGADVETDLAVLKINSDRPLTPVVIANSDSVQVGDWAVAIGSPFGLEATVTAGIVSATGRDLDPRRQFQRFIQTDAAINPGNSGGPLLNIKGEVIGVNSQIATRTGGSEGVGFALPMNMAARVYNDLIKDGRVTRGYIGVLWNGENSKPETLKALGVDHGVIVGDAPADGPAGKAGLKKDDIILAINGHPVKDGDDLVAHVADLPVGTVANLNVDRDGKKMDFKVTIRDRGAALKEAEEESAAPESSKPESMDVKFGISGRTITEDEKQASGESKGVIVTRVEADSFAEEIGMKQNDVITAINRQPVNSVEDIRNVQKNLHPGSAVAFRVVRMPQQALNRATRNKSGQEAATLFLSGTLPK
jgi:serine protease Do